MNIKNLLAFMLATSTILCLHGQNLIKNGNFAEGNSNKIAYWNKTPGNITLIDNTNAPNGKILSIENVTGKNCPMLSQNIKVKPHTKYLVTFFAKGDYEVEKGAGGAFFVQGVVRLGPQKEKARSEWLKYSRIISSGKKNKMLVSVYLHKARGKVYFKDIKFEEIKKKDLIKKIISSNRNNIVAAKTCTWNISPSQNGNPALLTDNSLSGPLMPMSKQKDAVIWTKIERKKFPLTLCFDLEKEQPVSEIMVSTSGGGIYKNRWPRSIRVYLSNDGKNYCYAGDIISASLNSILAPESRQEHNVRLYLKGIDTRARFIKLAITPAKRSFRCDEVQVYSDNKKQSSSLKPPFVKTLKADEKYLTEISSKMRFHWDIEKITDAVKKAKISEAEKNKLLNELAKVNAQIAVWKFTGDWKKFRAILPYNRLHSKIWSIYGKLLAAEKFSPLTTWTSYRYRHLGMLAVPNLKQKNLKLKMMRNEHRALTFNLTNASDNEKNVRFQLGTLVKGVNNQDWIKFFQVENVDTYYFVPKQQALVELFSQDGVYTTRIAPGMTRQIWLSFYSKNIPAGVYNSKIKITSGKFHDALPLGLTVSSIKISESPALTLAMYDTHDRRFKKELHKKVIKDLKDHLVSCKMTQALAPMLAIPDKSYFDKDGNLTKPLDFPTFDKYIKDNPGFRKYFFSQSSHCKKTFPYTPDSPNFTKAVSQWAKAWEKHLIEKKIPAGKILIQYYDEPTLDKAKQNLKWKKAVKAASKRVTTFNTYHKPLPYDIMMQGAELNDITTPTMTLALWAGGNQDSEKDQKLYEIFKGITKSKKELWLYMCIDPMNIDPVGYYRLQAWQCFKLGAKGSAFWSYFDTRGHSSWNKYVSEEKNYSPIYRDADSINSSKNWEAIREGVEDYEYLSMLAEKIKNIRKQGKDSVRSQKVLESAVKEALHGTSYNWYWYGWDNNSFDGQADSARLMVLKELERIQKK